MRDERWKKKYHFVEILTRKGVSLKLNFYLFFILFYSSLDHFLLLVYLVGKKPKKNPSVHNFFIHRIKKKKKKGRQIAMLTCSQVHGHMLTGRGCMGCWLSSVPL